MSLVNVNREKMLWKLALTSCLIFITVAPRIQARIHKLEIRNDVRRYIALSTFGFYEGGILRVNLTNFKAEPRDDNAVYGFSMDRTLSDAMNPYLDSHQEKCPLQMEQSNQDSAAIYLTMDLKNLILKVSCTKDLRSMHIYKDEVTIPRFRPKRDFSKSHLRDTELFPRKKRSTSISKEQTKLLDSATPNIGCVDVKIPMKAEIVNEQPYYNANFVLIVGPSEEGLYNLYFHSCPNYNHKRPVALEFTLQIEEDNHGNFLSAGEMPLPALYFMMALLFFLSGCFWVFILKKSKHPVFKIHYLMTVLVYLKSLSLLFHGINFHFIQTKGEHVAAWAILYYITHLLKGAVLFITIVLIGTGWDFIKHILSDKDKKLFMIVIPLQVLANVAKIIIEESEEGDIEHKTWRDVFTLVDLLCCGAILFPVVWSIRHLQEAAHTDGKAAVNLRKLKLFRHFYIMIVCYIYFTRIIVYLLKITVPFQYEWLDEMFKEMATYVFFILTGYKFRPASANPYFTIANGDMVTDDNDEEIDVVLFSSISGSGGVTQGLNKLNKVNNLPRSIPGDVGGTPEEKDNLLSRRESSHEYD
ncbi:protein GPR107 isoform X2 [Athalia rosae]|uniref:protein GPR107 isoform X2 n=1 Tax=Athalia rosae TaxID=37344 RepID=UPI002033AE1F|nr:protein GPR107 isoform X2 [Athalia rosae]